MPNAHVVCMLHQFFKKNLRALFCRNYGMEGFRKITFFGDGTRSIGYHPLSWSFLSCYWWAGGNRFSFDSYGQTSGPNHYFGIFSFHYIFLHFFFSQNFTSKPFIFSVYDEKGFDLINGVFELKRDIIISSTLMRYS